ncbi:MAG: RNA polymerase sigma factor [Deltaproteobacteria bacterium]|nr:RNA polymerase sigma factor [Deltaproteobacteria bacterium]
MEADKQTQQLIRKAIHGSRDALEDLVRRIQQPVYSLSLRMLLNRQDAEDAAQEIIIRVTTNLKGYRFEGPFRAWVLRIAVNKLKTVRKTFAEKRMAPVENLDSILDRYEAKGWLSKPLEAPEPYLEVETRSICIHALLSALNRSHRLAFILGVVIGVDSREGAQVLDISPAAYRQRLSRARTRIKDFLAGNCGILNDTNRCRCSCILPAYLENGWIHPDRPMFTDQHDTDEEPARLGEYLREMDELGQLSALYRSVSPSSPDFVARVKRIYDDQHYRILADPKLEAAHRRSGS